MMDIKSVTTLGLHEISPRFETQDKSHHLEGKSNLAIFLTMTWLHSEI